MSSVFGESLKLSIFGQSHGAAIGMTLDGIPAGLPVDADVLQTFLNRRAPGQNNWSTPRREEDQPEFLSGIIDGYTCGAPIAAVIRNTNTRSGDYANLKDCPRPGHADYTAQMKYGGFQDAAGGGHFSGRLTAPLCIAGGLCKQWLAEMGIEIFAKISSIGSVNDSDFDFTDPDPNLIQKDFPVIDSKAGEKMRELISQAKSQGDSVGGTITCVIKDVPVGLGEPMFGGIENRIAQAVYAIPAVKGIEFGDGFLCSKKFGSEMNDPFIMDSDAIRTHTNHSGGILGGISNGMPIVFRAAFKPTPSISRPQKSISISQGVSKELVIHGRHDPCIVPRAVPVVEAAAAIAIYDLVLSNTQTSRRKSYGS